MRINCVYNQIWLQFLEQKNINATKIPGKWGDE